MSKFLHEDVMSKCLMPMKSLAKKTDEELIAIAAGPPPVATAPMGLAPGMAIEPMCQAVPSKSGLADFVYADRCGKLQTPTSSTSGRDRLNRVDGNLQTLTLSTSGEDCLNSANQNLQTLTLSTSGKDCFNGVDENKQTVISSTSSKHRFDSVGDHVPLKL